MRLLLNLYMGSKEPFPRTKAALLVGMALTSGALAGQHNKESERVRLIREEASRPSVGELRLVRDIKDYPEIRAGRMVVLSLKNIPKADARIAEKK